MCFDTVVFQMSGHWKLSDLIEFVWRNEAKTREAIIKYFSCKNFGFLPFLHSEVRQQRNSSRPAAGGDSVSR